VVREGATAQTGTALHGRQAETSTGPWPATPCQASDRGACAPTRVRYGCRYLRNMGNEGGRTSLGTRHEP
jgi:hypothetical protein